MEDLQDWIRAIEQTWIVRYPKQNLATFGITNINKRLIVAIVNNFSFFEE